MAPRVVVPYVDGFLNPRTEEAVTAAGVPAAFVRLPADDVAAYGRLLAAIWADGRTTVLIEQDMWPSPGAVRDLASCGHRWCGFRYRCGPQVVGPSFGIARFSAALMADHPTLADQARRKGDRRDRPVPWWSLAEETAGRLFTVGETWSAHPGRVAHLHARGAYG